MLKHFKAGHYIKVAGHFLSQCFDCNFSIIDLYTAFKLEFCDDCSAPLFPNVDGELIHAELPEALNGASLTMH